MDKLRPEFTPDSYSTICPYLVVDRVEDEMAFLTHVFEATLKNSVPGPNKEVMHAEMQIGEITLMLGKASSAYPPRYSTNYIFVENVEEVFQKALQFGCQSMQEPTRQEYGFHEAGVLDLEGNQWWVATPLPKMAG